MTLLEYIPFIVDKDPGLAQDILNLEHYYVSSLVIIKKRMAEEQQQAQKTKKKRQKRSMWVRPYLRRRQAHGQFTNLIKELGEEDQMLYRNFLRFDKDTFHEIVERVRPLKLLKLVQIPVSYILSLTPTR